MLFGLVPARQIWATDSSQLIKTGAIAGSGFRKLNLRDFLLAVQIALCTLLVTSSLVALRGMQRSLHAPLGFDPQGTLVAQTDLHMGGYTDQSGVEVQKRILQAAAQIPGVTRVGAIDELPLGTGGSSTTVYREGTTDFRPSNGVFGVKYFSISPGYLEAASTRLLAGRDFNWHDTPNAPKVAIVNQTFARVIFGTPSAVGLRFMLGENSSIEIVGIVEDGKYESLTEAPLAAMFFPFEQSSDSDTALIVRSQLPPPELTPQLSRTLAQIDPSLPFTLQTWPDALALVLFPARVATASLGVMGILASMLAVTGIFGMAMYSVSRRMKELGIRVALGAQPMALMQSALGRPLVLLLSGSALGLVLGVVASRVLAQIVYDATPRDPLVLLAVMGVMAALGALSTWIPARRALKIDPANLLRTE